MKKEAIKEAKLKAKEDEVVVESEAEESEELLTIKRVVRN